MARTRREADLESKFQAHLIARIENELLPGSIVRKHDIQQGWPDLLVIYRNKWAMLEVKAFEGADEQPNQPYWVDEFNRMSFCAFIYPENEEEVLHGLEQALRPRRAPRSALRQ